MLSTILILSCMIILYIGEEGIFVIIFYYFKINGKQRFMMPKKAVFVKFKNYERKIKSLFTICRFWKHFIARK